MPQITVWQCPQTNLLFDNISDYRQHLRTKAVPLRRIQRWQDQYLAKCESAIAAITSARSTQELGEIIVDFFPWFRTNQNMPTSKGLLGPKKIQQALKQLKFFDANKSSLKLTCLNVSGFDKFTVTFYVTGECNTQSDDYRSITDLFEFLGFYVRWGSSGDDQTDRKSPTKNVNFNWSIRIGKHQIPQWVKKFDEDITMALLTASDPCEIADIEMNPLAHVSTSLVSYNNA